LTLFDDDDLKEAGSLHTGAHEAGG
jgi:hypothetical protein